MRLTTGFVVAVALVCGVASPGQAKTLTYCLDGIPEGSRAALPGYEWLRDLLSDPARNAKVRRLAEIADDLGCTLAQLSLAWCARNPRVSTVITGASRVEQVEENMAALDVLARLDDEVMERIDAAMRD